MIVDVIGREIIDSRGNPTVEAEVMLDARRRGPRRRAVGRLDRHARGGRTARRRQEALPRQGRAARPSGNVNGELARRAASASTPRTRRPRPADDRARRHRRTRRGSAPMRCSPCRWRRRRPRRATRGSAAVPSYLGGAGREQVMPVPMMNIINGGAHADNSVDVQEFMILPVGAPTLQRGAALRRRDLPRAEEGAARARARHRRRRRGRLRARTCRRTRRRSRSSSRRSSKAGYKPGKDIYLGLDVASSRVLQGRRLPPGVRGPQVHARPQFVDYLAASSTRYPDHHDRGRHGRGRLGRLGAADADGSASKVQLVGDDLFVTNTKILQRRHRRSGIANCHPDQAQPDRHADRDARGDRHGARRPATPPSSRTARAKPRTPPSPTSRSRPRATQIKTGSLCRSDRVAKYNQLLRIEAELGGEARYAGRDAFPVPLPVSCA